LAQIIIFPKNPKEWSDELKSYRRVHQLTQEVKNLPAKISALPKLTSLDLGENNLGAVGAKHLANLNNLASLNLENNNLSDAGAKHLANLNNLASLNLENNNLGAVGAKHLANLTNLTSLNLSRNKISNLTPLVGLIEKGVSLK
jgi:Leucine-rich repeat (LRR) protein